VTDSSDMLVSWWPLHTEDCAARAPRVFAFPRACHSQKASCMQHRPMGWTGSGDSAHALHDCTMPFMLCLSLLLPGGCRREQLEAGRTHDELWNAAQLEMVHHGKMHGFMRMYWAKKILEWTPRWVTGSQTVIAAWVSLPHAAHPAFITHALCTETTCMAAPSAPTRPLYTPLPLTLAFVAAACCSPIQKPQKQCMPPSPFPAALTAHSPAEALSTSIYLNDKYELDGRDPSGYVGCMWSIGGIHDMVRPPGGAVCWWKRMGCTTCSARTICNLQEHPLGVAHSTRPTPCSNSALCNITCPCAGYTPAEGVHTWVVP
jgi:hypothetical protein